MGNWVSVKDSLPPMKESYEGGPRAWRGLVKTGHHVACGSLEETRVKRIPKWKSCGGYGVAVTHWMEFPEPPQS